ncbi:hypothetical protein SRABI96_04913 [Peribacillus sp. Bi96]|uniref:hypothetical protein n=1 Tax=unclassified Peribacillus TaxID=2675266 RepID=UPI001D69FD9E|nr:hypothetical protein [Peribacillus sp. Bi96]CAH0309179.1 hypothetical protein SRABI96_04913 [Peribacillus sp. Bi96]
MGFDNILSVQSLKDDLKNLCIEFRTKYDRYESSTEYVSKKDEACQKALNDFKEYFETKGCSITEEMNGDSLTLIVNKINSGRFFASLEASQDKTLHFKIPESEYYQTISIIERDSNESSHFQGYLHNDELKFNAIKDHQKDDPNFYIEQIEKIKEDIKDIDEKINDANPEFKYELYDRNIFLDDFVEFLNIVDKEIK